MWITDNDITEIANELVRHICRESHLNAEDIRESIDTLEFMTSAEYLAAYQKVIDRAIVHLMIIVAASEEAKAKN